MNVFFYCNCGKRLVNSIIECEDGGLLLWENITQNGNCRAMFSDHAPIVGIVIATLVSEKNTKYSKKREKFVIHLVYNCLNSLFISL